MDSGENSINDDQFELEYQGTEDAEHMTCTEVSFIKNVYIYIF